MYMNLMCRECLLSSVVGVSEGRIFPTSLGPTQPPVQWVLTAASPGGNAPTV